MENEEIISVLKGISALLESLLNKINQVDEKLQQHLDENHAFTPPIPWITPTQPIDWPTTPGWSPAYVPQTIPWITPIQPDWSTTPGWQPLINIPTTTIGISENTTNLTFDNNQWYVSAPQDGLETGSITSASTKWHDILWEIGEFELADIDANAISAYHTVGSDAHEKETCLISSC